MDSNALPWSEPPIQTFPWRGTGAGIGYYTSCILFLTFVCLLCFVVCGPVSCGMFYFINFNKFENRLPIYILNFNIDSTTFNSRLNDSVLFRYCSSYNLVSRLTKRKQPWFAQPYDYMTVSLSYLYSWDEPAHSTTLRPPSAIVRRKRTKCKPINTNKNCIYLMTILKTCIYLIILLMTFVILLILLITFNCNLLLPFPIYILLHLLLQRIRLSMF